MIHTALAWYCALRVAVDIKQRVQQSCAVRRCSCKVVRGARAGAGVAKNAKRLIGAGASGEQGVLQDALSLQQIINQKLLEGLDILEQFPRRQPQSTRHECAKRDLTQRWVSAAERGNGAG